MMYCSKRKEKSGCGTTLDTWAAYRGKYPDPTAAELQLIRDYLRKFCWEDDDFVEDRYPRWISLKNRLQCPNLRDLLIHFVRQVRWSKGYDVDLYFDFIEDYYTIFVPRSLDDKKFYDEAMAAAKFAIGEINTQTMAAYEVVSVDKLVSTSYKTYEVVSVDKLVSTSYKTYKVVDMKAHPIITNLLLLTFAGKETTINVAMEQTSFQAMLIVCDQPPPSFQLKEWKFKPT